MHFPWKKSKVTRRISRLVAGLHCTPKRGGYLVLETGFPTSLVDLFVKNRDRFRKSSKRKSSSSPQNLCNDDLKSPDMDGGETVSVSREENFPVVLKVSLMVALAVSTRSLAIWIMMAALSLVIIEFYKTVLLFYPRIRMGLKPRTDESVVKRRGAELPDPCELVELKDETEAVTCKSERSRSSRIKTSLIKKFVPKKFLHGKRKKQGKSNNKPCIQLEKEKQEHGVDEKDESGTENIRKGNSGCAMILLVIILAGLIAGRGVALLLTLVCCCILIYYIGAPIQKDVSELVLEIYLQVESDCEQRYDGRDLTSDLLSEQTSLYNGYNAV
ncbi:hypothetical protein F3Y22_tig00117021pilonHSYRG00131 [Hibiscus syriacus]|uniref:Uncharacterized protein n=1 Tax=Hibiscus syriacus TaxID=106335 RepID=A0A6A2WCU7_HIBSY|nr:uncharacterized protein LOC120195915 [Hibiscus syriacus]KAE8655658.1 hypothetical protein F3Y22_tig00117021pilonHSYRG00131 [Hibiscus syriacus]